MSQDWKNDLKRLTGYTPPQEGETQDHTVQERTESRPKPNRIDRNGQNDRNDRQNDRNDRNDRNRRRTNQRHARPFKRKDSSAETFAHQTLEHHKSVEQPDQAEDHHTPKNHGQTASMSHGRSMVEILATRLREEGFWDKVKDVPKLLDLAEPLGKSLADVPSWKLKEETLQAHVRWVGRIQNLSDGLMRAKSQGNECYSQKLAQSHYDLSQLRAEVLYNVGRGSVSRGLKDITDVCLSNLQSLSPEVFPDALKGFRDFWDALYAYFFFFAHQVRR